VSAKFIDYQAGYAAQHADQLDPAKDALLFPAPEPIDESPERLKRLRKQVSEVQSATCNGLAAIGLPLKLRPLVCAVLAASNGETHFKASYKALVDLLFRQGDGRTFNAKKCEVRKLLRSLRAWQEQTKITLCTITPGGKTKDEKGRDEYHDTEFDLVFLDAVAKAMMRNPEPEKMRAAVRVEIAAMMKLPPFDNRWQVKSPTLEQMKERDEKSSVTMALKACEAEEKLNGDPVAYAEQLAAKIVAAAREKFEQTPPQSGADVSSIVDNAEVAKGGVCLIRHTPPSSKSDPKTAPQERRYKVPVLDDPPAQEVERSPEAEAAWKSLCERMRAQPVEVRTVEIESGAASDSFLSPEHSP
jgi:hypothetical protein